MQKSLKSALWQAIALLEKRGYRYAVIGGIAVQIWGKARFTHDVDIKVLVPDTEYAAARAAIRAVFPKRARPEIPANPLIVDAQIDEIAVDFLWAIPGYESNIVTRATRRKLDRRSIWICSAEDLIIQKAVANRPKDWLDVEGVLVEQFGELDAKYIQDWLAQFAEALDRPDLLQQYRDLQKRIAAILKRRQVTKKTRQV